MSTSTRRVTLLVMALMLRGMLLAAAPARLDELDREHLLMLLGNGLETWRGADTEILVGAVPWFVEMFVTVPDDIVIRASRVQARGGAAVVTLEGDGEKRLESIFEQLTREGWTRTATVTFRLGAAGRGPASPASLPEHLVPAGSFCRGDASIVVWKARQTDQGLDLKVSFSNGSRACRDPTGTSPLGSSLADPGPYPSIVDDPAVRTFLEVSVPDGGLLVFASGNRNESWSEWFSVVNTPSTVAETAAHYATQLGLEGWTVGDRSEGPGMAVVAFDSIAGGRSRRGVLTITTNVVWKDRKNLALRFDSLQP